VSFLDPAVLKVNAQLPVPALRVTVQLPPVLAATVTIPVGRAADAGINHRGFHPKPILGRLRYGSSSS
jgi:hypothetical protein